MSRKTKIKERLQGLKSLEDIKVNKPSKSPSAKKNKPAAPFKGSEDVMSGRKRQPVDTVIDQVRNIDTGLIRVSRANARMQSLLNEDSVSDLIESIKDHGQIQPAEVYQLEEPEEDGVKYVLISGSRRLAAIQELGLKHIRATVYAGFENDPESADQILHLLSRSRSENTQEWPTRYEYARKIKEIAQAHPDLTQEEIGEALGYARSTISDLMRFASFPEEAAKALGSAALRSLQAPKGIMWARQFDEDRLVEAITAVRTEHPDASGKQTIDMVDQWLTNLHSASEAESGHKGQSSQTSQPRWVKLPAGARMRSTTKRGRPCLEVELDAQVDTETIKQLTELIKKALAGKAGTKKRKK